MTREEKEKKIIDFFGNEINDKVKELSNDSLDNILLTIKKSLRGLKRMNKLIRQIQEGKQ